MKESMTTNGDWLESNHEGLYHQANATVKYLVSDVLTRIGITGTVLIWYNGKFIPAHDVFNAAFEDWLNQADRTPAKIATLISSERVFKPVYRELYNGYLRRNPLVTDTDLVEMRLPKRPTGGKTPPKPPTTLIEMTVDTSIPGTIIVYFRDKNERGTAKPKHVHGGEMKWAILDSPPSDWDQLVNSVFSTKSPIKLSFTGNMRGKTIYFAMRWENTVGQKGPWNVIVSAIIP
jgi:hypothetical protein